jgi:hypothetical protein
MVWGPVRTGTTLLGDLIAEHARWSASDLGLHLALTPPLRDVPADYDVRRPQRAVLQEVLASCETGRRGPLDLVYKQANLGLDEHQALVAVLGPPERTIFCLRDPAGFMRSAVRKFPDVDLDNLREVNYLGSIAAHAHIGGEVFVYHPHVTGDDYARFLAPLQLTSAQRESVRYSGSEAPELATDTMWEHYRALAARAVNPVS